MSARPMAASWGRSSRSAPPAGATTCEMYAEGGCCSSWPGRGEWRRFSASVSCGQPIRRVAAALSAGHCCALQVSATEGAGMARGIRAIPPGYGLAVSLLGGAEGLAVFLVQSAVPGPE